jgi:drug/metabolite transporter (DMT)-like permease
MRRTPLARAGTPLAALVGMAVVWGATYPLMKDATSGYPLFALLALRFAVAALALGVGGGRPKVTTLRAGLLLGVPLAAGYALQTLGLARATATATGFTTGLLVPMTPLLAAALFRERIGRAGWAAVALATAGVALLTGWETESLPAEALLVGGAGCFALHLVLTGRLAARHDPRGLTLVEVSVCAAAFAMVTLAREPLEAPGDATLWIAVLVTGLVATALGFSVQTWAQRRLTSTQAAIAITPEPVAAGVVGYLAAGERLGVLAFVGCAAILVAILAARTSRATERPRSRTEQAVGYTTGRVLKTRWATGPVPLRDGIYPASGTQPRVRNSQKASPAYSP